MKACCTFLAVLLMAGPLCSQDDDTRRVVVQIACTGFTGEHREISLPAGTGSWKDVPLSVRYPSEPVKASVTGNRLLVFAPDQRPTAEKPVEPLASIGVPASASQFLVLLFPSGREQPAYRGVAIPSKEFRFGGMCILNALNEPVAMTIDGKKGAVIRPQKSELVHPRIGGENRVVAVTFQTPKSTRPFYSANWNLRPDIREVHIMYLDPRTKRPRIKAIVDMKPATPPDSGGQG